MADRAPSLIVIHIDRRGLRYFVDGCDVTDTIGGLRLEWFHGKTELELTPRLPEPGPLPGDDHIGEF